ncbi:Uncharacterized protein pbN1_31790 [Aromatoleum bremense]|nr:Uncharacterized protein pbN1_31790 [Aromatoleum bremense]
MCKAKREVAGVIHKTATHSPPCGEEAGAMWAQNPDKHDKCYHL